MINILDIFEYNQHFVAMMNIINNARLCHNKTGHKHHVIPRCWFKYKNIRVDNSESNLVLLTPEDHMKVHRLALMCIKETSLRAPMAYAVHLLGGKCNIPDYKLSEEHKRNISEGLKGVNNPMYGKNSEDFMTPEAIALKRKHQSESHKVLFSDPEWYAKWYEASAAAQRTPERRKQISEQCKGKGNPMYGKDAWAISCSRKTPEQIEATRQSKREKMKAFWASPEGQIRKQQMAEHVSETKRRNKEELAHGHQV